MISAEIPTTFKCSGTSLVGILHNGEPHATLGVVIVVGGPQYRVGSHRGFVILARQLAATGIPVFRFDFRGMGDSNGLPRGVANANADIRAAIDHFQTQSPSLKSVVLLGLCDGASQSLLYCPHDIRIARLVLLNPWIRSEDGGARYPFRHYYLPRMMRWNFWKRILTGDHEIGSPIRAIATILIEPIRRGRRGRKSRSVSLASRMELGLGRFDGPVLLLISNSDLVGREFLEYAKSSDVWTKAIDSSQVTVKVLPNANHTMTARTDLDSAIAEVIGWLPAVRSS